MLISRKTVCLLALAVILIAMPIAYSSGESRVLCANQRHAAGKDTLASSDASTSGDAPVSFVPMTDCGPSPWLDASFYSGIFFGVVSVAVVGFDLNAARKRRKASNV